MSVGKYSPTVSQAYAMDQDWWYKNNTRNNANYDDDGFDRYGYNAEDIDRAGVHENEYIIGEWINEGTDDEEYVYELYERIESEWTADVVDGKVKPVRR